MKGPSFNTPPELGELLTDAELCATFMTAETSAVVGVAEGHPRRGYSDAVTLVCRELRWRREVDAEMERHAEIGRLVEMLLPNDQFRPRGLIVTATSVVGTYYATLDRDGEFVRSGTGDTLLDALRACAAQMEGK